MYSLLQGDCFVNLKNSLLEKYVQKHGNDVGQFYNDGTIEMLITLPISYNWTPIQVDPPPISPPKYTLILLS